MRTLLAFTALSLPAYADAPTVVADIAPVHSLVAKVMDGVGSPELLLPPGVSPHSYAMKPSDAKALSDADVVFHVGGGLTPWLEAPLGNLAGDARQVELIEARGLTTFDFRTQRIFELRAEEDHDHEEHGHEEHGHEEHGHDDHAHDDHADHKDHDDHAGHDDHGHDHAHDHDGVDPHAWLDPENAKVWVALIAQELGALDPENAEAYAENARAAAADLDVLTDTITAELEPFGTDRFVVFHDAYQYFEARFGLSALGSIAQGDATPPSPARLAELRDEVLKEGAACAFSEPQYNSGLINALNEGDDLKIALLDPLGVDLQIGSELYDELLMSMSDAFVGCLGSTES